MTFWAAGGSRWCVLNVCSALLVTTLGGLSVLHAMSVGIVAVGKQTGSPIVLLSSTATIADGPFAAVTIRNISRKAVKSITFGAFAFDVEQKDTKPLLYVANPMELSLAPGAVATVTPKVVDDATMEHIARVLPNGTLELGVVAIVFSDGGRYTFDVRSRGGFYVSSRR